MSAPSPRENSRRDLDPARAAERERVSVIVAATLHARGVTLTGSESSDQLADILSAVERFEAAVSALGGGRESRPLRRSSGVGRRATATARAVRSARQDRGSRRYALRSDPRSAAIR